MKYYVACYTSESRLIADFCECTTDGEARDHIKSVVEENKALNGYIIYVDTKSTERFNEVEFKSFYNNVQDEGKYVLDQFNQILHPNFSNQ